MIFPSDTQHYCNINLEKTFKGMSFLSKLIVCPYENKRLANNVHYDKGIANAVKCLEILEEKMKMSSDFLQETQVAK